MMHEEAEKRANAVNREKATENVFEIRRLTGFTRQQLAEILNVDRRTIHNWMQRGTIKRTDREHIAETLAVLRFADRGLSEENAKAMTERSQEFGMTPLEAIKEHQYSVARQCLSPGPGRPQLVRKASDPASWIGEFQPLLMHEGADGSESSEPLPEAPRPASRRRKIIRRG